MTGTILWTGSAGFPTIGCTDDPPTISGILLVPPVESPSGNPLTLLVFQMWTSLADPIGLFNDTYSVSPIYRGRVLDASGEILIASGGTYLLEVTTALNPLSRGFGGISFQTSSDVELGGPIDLWMQGSHPNSASTTAGLVYAMVVDFEFDPGFIPQLDFSIGSPNPPGASQLNSNGKTSFDYQILATTGSLLTFVPFFGLNAGSPSIGPYNPPQTVLYSDSVQYGAAAFAYEVFISPTDMPGGIYSGLPDDFPPPFITYTSTWSPSSLYTRCFPVIWQPASGDPFAGGAGPGTAVVPAGLNARVSGAFAAASSVRSRSFAQIIGA